MCKTGTIDRYFPCKEIFQTWENNKFNLPMFRTKIRGATIPDRFTTFCGMHASALLHWTEKQPPLTSKANSHESFAQHSSLQVFILVVRLRIENSPALAPSRRVAVYHSRPSLLHFFVSMLLDFEATIPATNVGLGYEKCTKNTTNQRIFHEHKSTLT